jgi:hypothetical protein
MESRVGVKGKPNRLGDAALNYISAFAENSLGRSFRAKAFTAEDAAFAEKIYLFF